MSRFVITGLFVLCSAATVFAGPAKDQFDGKLILKDASNGDTEVKAASEKLGNAEVGTSVRNGLPAGNKIKITINGARFGKTMAAHAPATVVVKHGNEVRAVEETVLSDTGYGEVTITTGEDWSGLHHVEVLVEEVGKGAQKNSNNNGRGRGRGRGGNDATDDDAPQQQEEDAGEGEEGDVATINLTGRIGRLETEFRVLDPEPRVEAPDGMPILLLLLGAVMMVVWMRRSQPQTA